MTIGDTIIPVVYEKWPDSTLDSITEMLELDLILGIAGEFDGLRVLEMSCGDGTPLPPPPLPPLPPISPSLEAAL